MLGEYVPVCFVATRFIGRARGFYVDVLGLEVVEDTEFALVVRAGPTVIRVTPVETHLGPPYTVLGWSVPDVGAVMTELMSRGVEPKRYRWLEQDELGIWVAPGGAKVAWFADPDNNILSLTES